MFKFLIRLIITLVASLPILVQSQDDPSLISNANKLIQISDSLKRFDDAARDCLTTLTESDTAQTAPIGSGSRNNERLCQSLLLLIGSDQYRSYKNTCEELREWREALSSEVLSSESLSLKTREEDSANSALGNSSTQAHQSEVLNQLLQVEYYCGTNALQNRSPNLINALRIIDQTYQSGNASSLAMINQLKSLQLELMGNRERQRLQQSLIRQRRQQEQNLRETHEQREREILHQELLRRLPQ